MRPSNIRTVTVAIFLVLCAGVVGAQPSVDETRIVQMRTTVQKLEGLVGDANIPTETKEQLSDLLFEKRGELHTLLRQKRDAMRSSLGTISAEESNSVRNSIQQLSREMQQLRGTATTAPLLEATEPHSSGGGSDNPTTLEASGDRLAAASHPLPLVTPLTSPATPVTPEPRTGAEAVSLVQPTAAPPPATQDPCVGLGSGGATLEADYQNQVTNLTCRILRAKEGRGNRTDLQLNFQAHAPVIALALAKTKLPKVAIAELTAQAEDASHAKNLTAGNSSSGGTSLVSKAGVPAIFGFAAENGGLTRTTDGSTVTFTGNPVGLVEAMAKKGFISSFQKQDDFTKVLRKFSFGLSFDTSRGAQPGTFTGTKQQLSGFSFKYNLMDQRDPRDSKHTERWQKITDNQASNLALALNNFVRSIATGGTPEVEAWLASTNQALTGKTTFSDIRAVLVAELLKLENVALPPEQTALVKQVGTDFNAFLEERNDILDEIANGWIATFDYNNTRPVGTPSLSNFRFLAEKGAYNGSIDFTGNASVTIYNSRPTGPSAKRLRDFRFAGQLDVPIGDISKTGKFLISLGGRYQRLLEDEEILGSTVVIPKGDIAAFQAKLTIPIRGTAFKIPLSFTYANRTELNKEREIRGNFGFTFDLDSIFARFNPFSKD